MDKLARSEAIDESSQSNGKPCFLCRQIAGDEKFDLLAKMLAAQPYQRRVILENDAFVVIPSLGALNDGHVLLCPKTHARSFAALGKTVNDELDKQFVQIKRAIIRLLNRHYGLQVHQFEHGMAAIGNHIPCTVDHAHLHFVPLPDSSPVNFNGGISWQSQTSALKTLASKAENLKYLLYESPNGKAQLQCGPAGSFPSQSMRRLFALSMGNTKNWNWRESPQAEKADAIWRSLFAVAN